MANIEIVMQAIEYRWPHDSEDRKDRGLNVIANALYRSDDYQLTFQKLCNLVRTQERQNLLTDYSSNQDVLHWLEESSQFYSVKSAQYLGRAQPTRVKMHLNKVTEGFSSDDRVNSFGSSSQIQAGNVRNFEGTSSAITLTHNLDSTSIGGGPKSSRVGTVTQGKWLLYGILAVIATSLVGIYPVLARYLLVPPPSEPDTQQIAPLYLLTIHLTVASLSLLFTYTIPSALTKCAKSRSNNANLSSATSEPLLSDLYRSVATSSSRPGKIPTWLGTILLVVLMCARMGCMVFACYFTTSYLAILMTLAWPMLVGLISWAFLNLPLPNKLGIALLFATVAACAIVVSHWEVRVWVWSDVKGMVGDGESRSELLSDLYGMGLALMSSFAAAGFVVTAQVSKRQLSKQQLLWIVCGSALIPASIASFFITENTIIEAIMNLNLKQYIYILLLALALYLGELLYQVSLSQIGAPLLSLLIPLRLAVAVVGSWIINQEAASNVWEVIALSTCVCLYVVYYGMQWARRRQVQRQTLAMPEL